MAICFNVLLRSSSKSLYHQKSRFSIALLFVLFIISTFAYAKSCEDRCATTSAKQKDPCDASVRVDYRSDKSTRELGPTKLTPCGKTPQEALDALIEGNKRYRNGIVQKSDYSLYGEPLVSGQAPFASILSCADSRVAPVIIFDVGLGNIFQVHLAGNVVDTQALGSLEYSVAVLNVPLIVVMAHTDCGAVSSAIHAYNINPKTPKQAFPPRKYGSISRVCRAIYPAVAALPPSRRTVPEVTRKNVALQVDTLLNSIPILKQAVRDGKLMIVGAEFIISHDPTINGLVNFFLI